MNSLLGIFSAFGLAASAGLNAYIPLLVTALLAKFTDLIQLSSPWDALTSWWIIGLLTILTLVEFFVDKIPLVNHVNDGIQTLVRPTAGAIIFAASTKVITDINPVLALALGLLVAGTIHAVKTVAVRPAVTATTAGLGNVPVSFVEDATSTTVSILSIVVPIAVAILFVILIIWLLWKFKLKRIFQD